MEKFDVVVIGAGWYGLIAARTFLHLAPETKLLIVDDSKTVGGVWSKERIYPSLFAQISHPLFEYSFYPMSKDRLSPDGFISGQTIHEYLVSFAEDHGLMPHMRLNTRVEHVKRAADGKAWIIDVKGKASISTDKLIYATGANSSPIVPKWASEKNDFDKPVIHSLETGTKLDYIHSDVKRATVVGRSKSSYDTVYQLLKAGKQVDWVMRNGSSGPFSLYSPSFIGLWNIADHISTRFASTFSPCIWNTTGFWYNFLHKSVPGRSLTNFYWWVADTMSSTYAGYSKSEDAEKLRPRPAGNGVFWGSGGIGIATVPDFWTTFHASDIKIHSTEIKSLSKDGGVLLETGEQFPSDIIIHCTGFNKGYDTFSLELQKELGLSQYTNDVAKWALLDERANREIDELFPILANPPQSPYDKSAGKRAPQGPNRHYRRLVPTEMAARDDRSILFTGHIHSAFTPLAAELQALWGVTWMLGWRDLPPQDELEDEAALFNAWTKKRYLEQGQKHAYFIYDYVAYIDVMMKDLGLNHKRKNNLFEELFYRYKPSDYNGIVDEYLANRQHEKTKLLAE